VAVADSVVAVTDGASKNKTTASSLWSSGDDVEVVGTKNTTRLPDMRQHCTERPFSADPTA
jgi:hypothetical protein